MLKQMILILTLILSLPQICKADVLTLPPLKQGFGYSIVDEQFNYFATTDLIQKWGFSLGAGYAGRAKETGDKLVSTLTYDIGNLQKWVDVPIAKYVDLSVGLYAGLGRVQLINSNGGNEFDWGVVANIVSIKF